MAGQRADDSVCAFLRQEARRLRVLLHIWNLSFRKTALLFLGSLALLDPVCLSTGLYMNLSTVPLPIPPSLFLCLFPNIAETDR